MQDRPDIPDERLIACLDTAYGLRIDRLDFLPIGGDLSTAVYRAVARDGDAYFCKLKLGAFDETSVALPELLRRRGVEQIIAPRRTRDRLLRAPLGEHHLIVYPFVEGRDAYEVTLSEGQWAQFGAAMQRIHATVLPRALGRKMRKERFSPEWRDRCRGSVERLDRETFTEPIAAEAAALLLSHRETLRELLHGAEWRARAMVSCAPDLVLCHTDIHPGNLLIGAQGAVHIVDWDYPMLAPVERDLMFIGGGQGFAGVSADEEVARFAKGYGEMSLDTHALAYYRCERCVTDIAVECGRVLSPDVSEKDRAMSLQILRWTFDPGGSVEIALRSDAG